MGQKLQNRQKREWLLIISLSVCILFTAVFTFAATPEGTDPIAYNWNETKTATSAKMVNISGGYISSFNLSAEVQNSRWKAFVGHVSGSFTLSDASGNEIYDWSMATVSGNIYSTRHSGGGDIEWATIYCANSTEVDTEDSYLEHAGTDNISSTFVNVSHSQFYAAGINIPADTCPTLNTYVNNNSQDTSFEEMVLADGDGDIVFTTIIENAATGFDGNNYDFQMIVPENGSASWSSATPYYMYVELLSS
jgi:hypothetical protein